MKASPYERLEDVILDPLFPEVDQALRRGRHVDQEDLSWYAFLNDTQSYLEPHYRRYGADLVRSAGGYFYLLADGGVLRRKRLSSGAMLVGQALALAYLDPATTLAAGLVPRSQVLETLANLVGEERLLRVLNPQRRREAGEKVAHETIRKGVDQGLRQLRELGFITQPDPDTVRMRAPLLRFVEPIRGMTDPGAALRRLLSTGEIGVETDASFEEDEA